VTGIARGPVIIGCFDWLME